MLEPRSIPVGKSARLEGRCVQAWSSTQPTYKLEALRATSSHPYQVVRRSPTRPVFMEWSVLLEEAIWQATLLQYATPRTETITRTRMALFGKFNVGWITQEVLCTPTMEGPSKPA